VSALRTTLTVFACGPDGAREVIGWIHPDGDCENEACRRAVAAGMRVHAIPRDATLDTYHFATIDDAHTSIVASYSPEAR
jgi:hypothetical protein